ncbi:MAG: SDR family NAD(P)-dependent oxidoreductase [Deltaproteobacteria bacterium]|nr:SDR family NAD(P)-dependent oxidoreductase [Deltaproteobacteria bacterium]
MAKTILVVGYGPGISTAVAEKFGKEGFAVGLVARNRERLDAGVKALEAKGIEAAAFAADAGDASAIRGAVRSARKALGPITVIEWTAYGSGAGDLLTATDEQIRGTFDIAIGGLVAAVQEALPDLEAAKDGAVLVTNGMFGEPAAMFDKMAVDYKSMDLALSNAAKHKLVRMLAIRLQPHGVFAGEVMVAGTIKGTAWDRGDGSSIDPSLVADKHWAHYKDRKELQYRVPA